MRYVRCLALFSCFAASATLAACGEHAPGFVAAPVAQTAPSGTAGPTVRGPFSVSTLHAAVRDYLENHDPHALFALWADDLAVRAGRVAEPSRYDSLFGRERLAPVYRWAAAHQPSAGVRFRRERVTVDQGVVHVDWVLVLSYESDTVAFGERYWLERRAGEYRIVRFEYWPLLPDTLEGFRPERFAEFDSKVEEARGRGDDAEAAYNLMLGYRFDECSTVVRHLTDATPASAWAWEMRAKASALIGDGEDAERSSAEAKRLRPDPSR